MANFDEEIQQFQRYGTYTYKYDSVGNLLFDGSSDDFSKVRLSLPLFNVKYNNTKIAAFQKPTFEEFVPSTIVPAESTEELQQKLNVVADENASLKEQLNTLVAQSETNSSGADALAMKQVILELRIRLGEGRFESDFSQDFPYMPIIKEKKQ
jgi:hypothetical protein